MNLIVLIGSGAVGKMTVGQELMKITDYRLFHNHHILNCDFWEHCYNILHLYVS